MSYNSAISIHALREEGDHGIYYGLEIPDLFLSTPSARRATLLGPGAVVSLSISIHALREEGDKELPFSWESVTISIHALREEGDFRRPSYRCSADYFYPRPPRGGRRKPADRAQDAPQFLSTPSARRATHGDSPKAD